MALSKDSSLQIVPVTTKGQLKAFIKLPWKIYKNDPHWVPPLLMEENNRFDPRKNPVFEHLQAQYYLAYRGDEVVGRISAQVDHLHNQTHDEKCGFFGCFECIDDELVAHALLDAAWNWLKTKNLNCMRGPFTLNINEESGLLIEGFDTDPYILMAHHQPYYLKLLESFGLKKTKDLLSWKYDAKRPVPEPAQQISDVVAAYPGLKIREVNKKNLAHDTQIIMDIFNEAWSKNWGFVPLTAAEIGKAVKDFQLILEPKLALIAEVNGEPAAISLALPNINEAIKDLNGKLFPFGLIKLLYRLKTNKIKHARQIILGVRKKFRGDILGGLSVLLYSMMHRNGASIGIEGGECSWTLEDNEKINMGISLMGGEVYKKYRILEMGIE